MSFQISNPTQSLGLEQKSSSGEVVIKTIPAGSKFQVEQLTPQMKELEKIGLLRVRKATTREVLTLKKLTPVSEVK